MAAIDRQSFPLRRVASTARVDAELAFDGDGTTVRVTQRLALGATIRLGRYIFSNNGTSAAAMPTHLKQRAWREIVRAACTHMHTYMDTCTDTLRVVHGRELARGLFSMR